MKPPLLDGPESWQLASLRGSTSPLKLDNVLHSNSFPLPFFFHKNEDLDKLMYCIEVT